MSQAVAVVYALGPTQWSTEDNFHHEAMLEFRRSVAAVGSDGYISV